MKKGKGINTHTVINIIMSAKECFWFKFSSTQTYPFSVTLQIAILSEVYKQLMSYELIGL